jgi:hypothetical protein
LSKAKVVAADAAVVAELPETALRDEYAGKGGSYIYDPASGKRTVVNSNETPAEGQVNDE